MYFAKSKKLHSKVHAVWFHLWNTVEKPTISGFQEVGLRGWADYKRTRKPFGAGKILYLDCCSFTTLCALVKTQQKKRTNFAM